MVIVVLKLKLLFNEVWNVVMVNVVKVIDINVGIINIGDKVNLVIWDVLNYEYILYYFGINYVEKVIKDGKVIVDNILFFKV